MSGVPLSYDSLGNDGLREIVDLAVSTIKANIEDENTSEKAMRKLTIEVKFKPTDDSRAFIGVEYGTRLSLASVRPVAVTAMADRDGLIIPEIGVHPDQHELPVNVTKLKKEAQNV
jgi:hypothetical protein